MNASWKPRLHAPKHQLGMQSTHTHTHTEGGCTLRNGDRRGDNKTKQWICWVGDLSFFTPARFCRHPDKPPGVSSSPFIYENSDGILRTVVGRETNCHEKSLSRRVSVSGRFSYLMEFHHDRGEKRDCFQSERGGSTEEKTLSLSVLSLPLFVHAHTHTRTFSSLPHQSAPKLIICPPTFMSLWSSSPSPTLKPPHHSLLLNIVRTVVPPEI